MMFEHDTFVILDVPAPIADQVKALQQRYHDEALSSILAHITVIGSGGVGVFDPVQEADQAFVILNTIAAETQPIRASFGKVLRFPNTDIFVLTLKDEYPLFSLHGRIVKSGLRFKPSQFPFVPHCTICTRSPISNSEPAELLSVQIPGQFTLDTMSLYEVDGTSGRHLRRFKLRGHGE